MTSFRIDVDDVASRARLGKLNLFLSDLRPFWPLLVPVVTGWWRLQFKSQGGFAGHPWAALSPGYAEAKAADPNVVSGAGILVSRGALKQAASKPSRSVSPTQLTLTIDDPKLQYHQSGTGTMPARPLVFGSPLPAEAQASLNHIADVYVRDLLRRL